MALIVITKTAIKKRILRAYIVAAKVVKEVQLTAGALMTLWKQW